MFLAVICLSSCRTPRKATIIDQDGRTETTAATSTTHLTDTMRDTTTITTVILKDTNNNATYVRQTIIRTLNRNTTADSMAATAETAAAERRQTKTEKDNDNKLYFFLYGLFIIFGLLIIILTWLGRSRG